MAPSGAAPDPSPAASVSEPEGRGRRPAGALVWGAVALTAVLGATVAPAEWSVDGARVDVVLALLGTVVVLWVTEAIPLWATSLSVPLVLTVAGVQDATTAAAPFAHPIIVLFFAGFLMAAAMRRVGLDREIARRMLLVSGGHPVRLYLGFVGLAGVLSMFMSNTAAVAILLPIALTVTADLGSIPYRKTVVLGTAYAATIGGVGSAIGTPANLLAITFLDDLTGQRITFLGWFAYGLPVLIVMLPATAWWVWRTYRPTADARSLAHAVARAAASPARPRDRGSVVVLVVMTATFVGWLTEPLHGLHVGMVALAGALVLVLAGQVRTDDLATLPWASLLTFGGGLALGVALTDVGIADQVAADLAGLAAAPELLAIVLVAGVALLLTTVASNTAAAAIFVPLAIPLGDVLGLDPALLVVVVAIASSMDFALVIGTPPTMLAYATGLYRSRELLRVGVVLDLVALVAVSLVLPPVWRALGLVG